MISTAKEKITEVRMWDALAGYAYWVRDGQYARFQYDPSFLEKGHGPAPLTMPLSGRIFEFGSLNRETYQGLPGMLSDSLPDSFGNELIDTWLSGKGIPKSEFTPLDRLCYVGKRGMGALEYRPSVGGPHKDGPIDADSLSSLAAEILLRRSDFRADLDDKGLQELLSVGTSAGGARAKATVGLNEDTGEIRSGQTDLPPGFGYWIIKFDTEKEKKKGYCRVEYAYHEMAKACGIEMTRCRLLDTGSRAHFMTERFDRRNGERTHMQTLCALAHYDFRVPGRYSYEDMFAVMRLLRLPYGDMEQMYRRMVFNVVMRNQDDHTKNFSFLMGKDGKWRLSPAYDITFAYDPENYWTHRHQMSVNGKLDLIDRKDLTTFAQSIGIRDPDDIIDTVSSAASEWEVYAKMSDVPLRTAEAVGKALLRI
ncbi:MAG: type II toxin-antitoxin system HipA family toxin [Methanomassiliicoccaceae archaeon]|nr:type II toxin-antitoxin system HipA family toxin [Methanomassiliicoccaceae archaeon]